MFESYLHLDEEMLSKTKLDVARLVVKTSFQSVIDEVLKVQINGSPYEIKIAEDPNFHCGSIGNSQSDSNSSSMVDSDLKVGFRLEESDGDDGIATPFVGLEVQNSNFENEYSVFQNFNSQNLLGFSLAPSLPQKKNPFSANLLTSSSSSPTST